MCAEKAARRNSVLILHDRDLTCKYLELQVAGGGDAKQNHDKHMLKTWKETHEGTNSHELETLAPGKWDRAHVCFAGSHGRTTETYQRQTAGTAREAMRTPAGVSQPQGFPEEGSWEQGWAGRPAGSGHKGHGPEGGTGTAGPANPGWARPQGEDRPSGARDAAEREAMPVKGRGRGGARK